MYLLRQPYVETIASALLVLCVAVVPAFGQSTIVSVPGTANPYLAGMPTGSTCCAGETGPDSVPAQSPTQVTGVPLTAGAGLTFNVSGSVSNVAGQPPVDPPDGSVFFDTAGGPGTPSSNGIAGMIAPVNALVGLFLNDNLPTLSGAPAGLDFRPSGLGTAFLTLNPALKQVFFIGDGRTGNGGGTVQQFIVPAGATRFFLGTVDGFGWNTNSGAFSVQVIAQGGGAGPLAAAILPSSRSVQVGGTATAFATIINAGSLPAVSCGISPATSLPATSFLYQTTNPATNALTGTPNTPATFPPGASQSYLVALTPGAAFGSTDVAFSFQCGNAGPATTISGVNTLLLTASSSPAADVIALAATANNTGILNVIGGTGAFAVATFNVGAASTITASVDTGSANLPLALGICQTNGAGNCIGTAGPSVTLGIGTNATPTFAIFAGAGAPIGFNPAANRIFVRFKDGAGVTRGATSVAVRTQ